ncbi:hypothetical protein [Halobellus ruber]|uniref:Uncharacterized protein n=1 Tax=Halobellus ruber TaxID=2761102 RepID=A0A7J9SK83_9EURY|nr:hypothetical protein [Halobellus ruber]
MVAELRRFEAVGDPRELAAVRQPHRTRRVGRSVGVVLDVVDVLVELRHQPEVGVVGLPLGVREDVQFLAFEDVVLLEQEILGVGQLFDGRPVVAGVGLIEPLDEAPCVLEVILLCEQHDEGVRLVQQHLDELVVHLPIVEHDDPVGADVPLGHLRNERLVGPLGGEPHDREHGPDDDYRKHPREDERDQAVRVGPLLEAGYDEDRDPERVVDESGERLFGPVQRRV